MSDSTASLRRKIDSANDLQSVVRTMKTLAASSVGQYEKSVSALGDYNRIVELGLGLCFRAGEPAWQTANIPSHPETKPIGVVVFGSDQGLVGQFNDRVTDFAVDALAAMPGQIRVWAVGDRVSVRLEDAGLELAGVFAVPHSVKTITPLVGQILVENEAFPGQHDFPELHLFYNRSRGGAGYEPVRQQLLPLDEAWRHQLAERPWPTKNLPEVIGGDLTTLRALIREYLFVSIYRACAESLASENASRLIAMTRADKNIDELLAELNGTFHQARQNGIDEELFDVISGFEALSR